MTISRYCAGIINITPCNMFYSKHMGGISENYLNMDIDDRKYYMTRLEYFININTMIDPLIKVLTQ